MIVAAASDIVREAAGAVEGVELRGLDGRLDDVEFLVPQWGAEARLRVDAGVEGRPGDVGRHGRGRGRVARGRAVVQRAWGARHPRRRVGGGCDRGRRDRAAGERARSALGAHDPRRGPRLAGRDRRIRVDRPRRGGAPRGARSAGHGRRSRGPRRAAAPDRGRGRRRQPRAAHGREPAHVRRRPARRDARRRPVRQRGPRRHRRPGGAAGRGQLRRGCGRCST